MAVGDICDHPLILSPTAGLRFRSRWPGELLTTTSRVPQLTCIFQEQVGWGTWLTTTPTFMIKECWFRIPVAGIFWYKISTKTMLLTSKPIAISNTRYQCQSRIWIDLLGVCGRNFGRGEIWVATLIRVEVASVKDTREEPRHSCLGHSPIPSPLSLPDLGGLLEPAVVVVVVVEITREEPAFLRWSLSSLSIYQPLPKTTCHPTVWREIWCAHRWNTMIRKYIAWLNCKIEYFCRRFELFDDHTFSRQLFIIITPKSTTCVWFGFFPLVLNLMTALLQ